MVTIPTVRISNSFAIFAMTGPAPVPVPPPIPAVMNTILVPSLKRSFISSMLSSAASRARSGRFPAPRPSVVVFPNCTLRGTSDRNKAWLSVLHKTNVTSCIPSLYIWLTAFPPPPPTPITFIMEGVLCGPGKSHGKLSVNSSMVVYC